jgi:hypothetical protein
MRPGPFVDRLPNAKVRGSNSLGRAGILPVFSSRASQRRPALLPSHGENRGSSPLGSASVFKDLDQFYFPRVQPMSNKHGWTGVEIALLVRYTTVGRAIFGSGNNIPTRKLLEPKCRFTSPII